MLYRERGFGSRQLSSALRLRLGPGTVVLPTVIVRDTLSAERYTETLRRPGQAIMRPQRCSSEDLPPYGRRGLGAAGACRKASHLHEATGLYMHIGNPAHREWREFEFGPQYWRI